MNKVVKNYLYNLSYQILILFVPLITTPYVSRVLGAKGVGIFSYTNSIVQYFILFGCIGLNVYGQREIAYVQHDLYKRSKVFWELLILRFITVSSSLIVFIFTLATHGQYAYVFIIMTLDIISSMVDISWFFQGIEDFRKIVIRNFLVKLIGVALIFIFVKNSNDLVIYVLCHSLTIFLGNLSIWFYLPKFIQLIPIKTLQLIRHIKPTVMLFLPQIAVSVYTVLDKTMIGLLTGIEEEVAYYEQSQKLVRIVMTIVTSLGTVMLPRVAYLFKNNETRKIREYIYKSFRYVYFLSFPMMFGLIALAHNIVTWFLGAGYDKAIPNIILISPIIVIIGSSTIIGTQFLLPTGRQKQYTISVILGCVVNCFLNFILIPYLFSVGAAIATVIAEITVTAVQIFFTKKDFDYISLFKTNIKYFICAIGMFIPTYVLSGKLTTTILNTFICVVFGGAIYILLLLVSRDSTVMEVKNSIISRIKGGD